MKKLFIIAFAILPLTSLAQSEWELPEEAKTEVQQTKKEKKPNNSTHKAKQKSTASKLDPRYAEGAVPEVDGKVVWKKMITIQNGLADELYERVLKTMQTLTKDSLQSPNSRIVAVNKRDHIVAAKFDEEMVFSTSFMSKDYAHFRYTMIATCKDYNIELKLYRISYEYTAAKTEIYTAEEWITDSKAINKNGSRLYPLSGKFRKKTIERVEDIFDNFEKVLKNN